MDLTNHLNAAGSVQLERLEVASFHWGFSLVLFFCFFSKYFNFSIQLFCIILFLARFQWTDLTALTSTLLKRQHLHSLWIKILLCLEFVFFATFYAFGFSIKLI